MPRVSIVSLGFAIRACVISRQLRPKYVSRFNFIIARPWHLLWNCRCTRIESTAFIVSRPGTLLFRRKQFDWPRERSNVFGGISSEPLKTTSRESKRSGRLLAVRVMYGCQIMSRITRALRPSALPAGARFIGRGRSVEDNPINLHTYISRATLMIFMNGER